jgi:hypothetical protein
MKNVLCLFLLIFAADSFAYSIYKIADWDGKNHVKCKRMPSGIFVSFKIPTTGKFKREWPYSNVFDSTTSRDYMWVGHKACFEIEKYFPETEDYERALQALNVNGVYAYHYVIKDLNAFLQQVQQKSTIKKKIDRTVVDITIEVGNPTTETLKVAIGAIRDIYHDHASVQSGHKPPPGASKNFIKIKAKIIKEEIEEYYEGTGIEGEPIEIPYRPPHDDAPPLSYDGDGIDYGGYCFM